MSNNKFWHFFDMFAFMFIFDYNERYGNKKKNGTYRP